MPRVSSCLGSFTASRCATRLRPLTSAALCLALLCSGCKRHSTAPAVRERAAIPVNARLLIPQQQAYLGAYLDFGETEDEVSYDDLRQFARLVGKDNAIIAFSSFWGKRDFPARPLQIVVSYGAMPLVFWNPWAAPYQQHKRPDAASLRNIMSGAWDAYIDAWAEGARRFGRPMLVAWGLEMNGVWFPWCGYHYGGGKRVPGSHPPRYEGPELYKRTYRYVVDRMRAKGASNIEWVFHANNTSDPDERWNRFENYYPGDEYVDWLALSAYGKQFPGPGWSSFSDVFPRYYGRITALAPNKPFLLAEWGIGEYPQWGDKAAYITEALARLSTEFPQLKGAVYWHERWQNGDLSYSNLRVNSSVEALRAYRQGVTSPFWLERPLFRKAE